MLNNPFKYSDPSGHYAIPVMMEDNFRPAPKKQLKVAPSLAKDSKKEEAFQKAEIAQIQTITQKKVANVPSSLKKTIQEIEDYQKAEVAQIQTIHKSTLEVIQKNDAKNEENMSRMSESSRKVVEEQIKNREILNKASKSKNEYLSNEHRKLTQQTEERSKIIQSGAIASFIAVTSMFGVQAIASMPVLIPVLGAAVALGGLIPILAGIGIIAGLVGLRAGLTLYNTGTKGTDLSGRKLNSREANLRKNVGSEMAATNFMNVASLITSLILYNNDNKTAGTSSTTSNKVNQVPNKHNQPQINQENLTDDISSLHPNQVGTKTITLDQYDSIMDSATHNPSAKNIMLGKYDNGGPTSYTSRAGDDFTYFDLGKENWNSIKDQYGYIDQDMFKLFNESFLDDGINARKDFYSSHNPIGDTGALGQELNYILENGYELIKNGTQYIAIPH